jgi:radical SAM protein with 4Fe4S-binding SPASM domain
MMSPNFNFGNTILRGVRRLRNRPKSGDFGVRHEDSDISDVGRSPELAESAAARIFHFRRESPGEKSRIHLRIDPDGHGTLIVNASRILHLNPTAALMAYHVLEGTTDQETVRQIRRKYRVSPDQARADLESLRGQLEELIRPDGACPIHELGLETIMPFSARPGAPYRLDLALTYRCNNDCAHCYNVEHPSIPIPGAAGEGLRAELSTAEWKRVLDRAWELGIPHIIFTGGEPTLHPDLAELVAHAEGNGQITGLNTNARRLADADYVAGLVKAGLDHVQITLESGNAEVHDRMVQCKGAFAQTVRGLQNALSSPLYVMTNTTMLKTNVSTLPGTLDFLAELGVPTIGLNALIHSGRGRQVGTGLVDSELSALLLVARQKTEARGQRLIWYTPTQYCAFDPMTLDLGVKGCTAALYNMCVEPDGNVLPCQSYYQPLGNLLVDEWDSIWNHDLAVRLRERQGLPAKCTDCTLLAECGGGCPLQFESMPMALQAV